MIRSIFGLCVFAMIFSACENGEMRSGSVESTDPNPGLSDPDLLLAPEGQFLLTQQLPETFTGHYGVGCLTIGQWGSQPQIDSRLTAGMEYEIAFRSLQPNTPLISGAAVGEVLMTTASSILMEGEVTAVSGISGISVGFDATRSCTLNSGSFSCLFLPPASYDLPNGAYETCTINTPDQESWVISSGTFTTLRGQTVPAYHLRVVDTGTIVCDGTPIGAGERVTEYILSNNVPAEDTARFCGGVKLFEGNSYYLSDGTHVLTSSTEKRRVPVIP